MLLFSFRQLRSFTSSSILSSKNEDETDKPIENDGEKNKKEELTSKLNSLLQTMVQVVKQCILDGFKPRSLIVCWTGCGDVVATILESYYSLFTFH